jgi:F-type H+-transporting ATPase subunit b
MKLVARLILAAAIFFGVAAVPAVRAQDQAATPAQTQLASADQAPATAETKKPEQGQKPQKSQGIGRQLAHETREAAGEETDETAEFKQSASVSFISRLTGLNLQQSYWLCVLLNFVVIAAVLVWAARKNLPGIFRARTASIQKAMQEAQKASEEARRRLGEIEARLAKLDTEIGAMRDAAEKEGAAEEARIKAAAEEDARKIIASAEQEISAAAKNARRQLTAYAADLAVGLAKKQIHVDASTDQALVRNFAGQLTATADAPGKDRN